MNPSTRPVVAGPLRTRPDRPAAGRDRRWPTRPGIPAENTGYPAGAYESIPFTVGGPPEVDNGRMTVHIEWANPETDWDLYVVDSDGRGRDRSRPRSATPPRTPCCSIRRRASTPRTWSTTTRCRTPSDDWTNGNVTFQSPQPTTIGPREAWTLTCEDEEGRLQATRNVFVDRGGQIDVGRVCSGAFSARAQKRG